MGITGLLPMLRSVTDDVHIREFTGKTIGIDSLCWIHRAIFTCASELAKALDDNPTYDTAGGKADALMKSMYKYIRFCEERLDMLLEHGIRPYFVFDGGALPAKLGKEEERSANRKSALQLAQLTKDSAKHQALYAKAIDVSPQLAYEFIKVLKMRKIDYIVAPYEADAQLAFLALNEIVDVVLTEDSDLLAYRAPHVLYKLTREGTAQYIQRCRLRECTELSFHHFDDSMFLNMCILAGCDYLPSIDGMGIKKAYEMARKAKSVDKLLSLTAFQYGAKMPVEYPQLFMQARMTFLHQRVYDPRTKSLAFVSPLPDGIADTDALNFLGPFIPDNLACAIAEARIDPSTLAPYVELPEIRRPSIPQTLPTINEVVWHQGSRKSRADDSQVRAPAVTPLTKFFPKVGTTNHSSNSITPATVVKDAIHHPINKTPGNEECYSEPPLSTYKIVQTPSEGFTNVNSASKLQSGGRSLALERLTKEATSLNTSPRLMSSKFFEKRQAAPPASLSTSIMSGEVASDVLADVEFVTSSGAHVLQIGHALQAMSPNVSHNRPSSSTRTETIVTTSNKTLESLAEIVEMKRQDGRLQFVSAAAASVESKAGAGAVLQPLGIVSPNMAPLPRRSVTSSKLDLDFEAFRFGKTAMQPLPAESDANSRKHGNESTGRKRKRAEFTSLQLQSVPKPSPLQLLQQSPPSPIYRRVENEALRPPSPSFDDDNDGDDANAAGLMAAAHHIPPPASPERPNLKALDDHRYVKRTRSVFIPSAAAGRAMRTGASFAAYDRLGIHSKVALTPEG